MADWKQIFARLIGRTDSGITPASSPLPAGVDPDGDEGKAHRTPVQSWLAVLGSLAMAFCIWLFVMGTDNPGYEGEFEDVPVRIENLSSLSLLSGDDLAVDLKVQGRRSVIASTDPSDIDVSVTVTSGTRPGRHSYDLNIQLPGGLTLVESSLTKVMLYLDNPTSTSVPIRVRLTDYILPDSYEIATEDQITTSLQSVSVTGPESLLQTISHAQVTLSLGQVTRSVTCIGALALIDNTGSVVSSSYVRMAQSEVSVTIPVYKYRTITPTILYEYGYFNESNVRITCTPATITVKGEADAVDRAEWVKTINEKTLASDSTLSFSVGFDEGVEVVGDVDAVSVRIEHVGTATRSMTIAGLRVINAGNRAYELLDDSINVTFRGDHTMIMSLTAAMVRAEVDLSKYNMTDGTTVSAPVTLTVLGAYAGQVWEVGSYAVNLRFTSTRSRA